ncbi:MAG: sulfur relay protein DsrC [Gammaproteobacteria bacterium]|nr:sulfur relay protein DsrC [Gammaproteobacteria bacterium]
MLWLSEVLMQNQELESFEDLTHVIIDKAKAGERFFSMDVRPPFLDTPENWEEKLEAIFTSVN